MSACRYGVTILSFILLLPFVAQAQSSQDFIGTWYSETKENNPAESYDIRRELIQNRKDGTKTNTFRYYRAGAQVSQMVVTYVWGVDKGIYWTTCQSVFSKAQINECSARLEYDILSVKPDEIQYRSKQNGTVYSIRRVPKNFRLP